MCKYLFLGRLIKSITFFSIFLVILYFKLVDVISPDITINLILSFVTSRFNTFSNDFEGYVLIVGRDALTFDYDAPTVNVQYYYTYFGNVKVYTQNTANVTIQKTFIYCKAKAGDTITINDYYAAGEFYLFKSVSDKNVIIPIYTINQTQGGAWIDTEIDIDSLESFLFIFYDENSAGNYLMRQIPTSDIVVYTGGTDVYTTIFTSAEIGKIFNVRFYNNSLYVSFNQTGESTKKVMICKSVSVL